MPIQLILKKWLVDENAVEEMIEYTVSNQKTDEDECRTDILKKIYYIMETYDNLEKDFISVIDNKNRQYTKATTQKIDYLINSDQTVKGNLLTLLKYISNEKYSEKVCGLLENSFELYELSFINEESLYSRKKSIKRDRNSELIMTDIPVDFEIKAKAMALQMMNNKYSKQNVAAFVDKLLEDKNEVSTKDFEIKDDDTYIMTLLSVVQANDRNSRYTVNISEKFVRSDKYEIPIIVYRRRK